MGMGMGMVRAICPNYIKDVVHPRNGWLETVLPPAMTAAGILLGQVAAVLQLEFSSRCWVASSPGGGFVLHIICGHERLLICVGVVTISIFSTRCRKTQDKSFALKF